MKFPKMEMSTGLVKWIIGLLAVLLLVGVSYVLYDVLVAPRPVGSVSVVAEQAPALRLAPTVSTPIKAPVKTFRGKTKQNLKLPAKVIADDKQQVIAASQVKSSLRPQTISTTIDTDTGAVETYAKTDPYPWFAVETRGEAKVAYGYKYSHAIGTSAPIVRMQLNYDAIRIKALTAGITATVDTDRDAFVGIGLSYKW
jgi:hypothetical protein